MTYKNWEIILVLLLLVPQFFINIRDTENWGDDYAGYLLQAKNVSEGKSHHQTAYIYNEADPAYAPPVYPVGFPLIVAPFIKVFGIDFKVLNYLMTSIAVLWCLFCFLFFRSQFSFLVSVCLLLLIGYNDGALNQKAHILSDIPFSMFVMLAIWLWQLPRNKYLSTLIGLSIAAAYLIRSPGVLLLVAWVGYAVWLTWRKKDYTECKLLGFGVLGFGILTVLINLLFPSKSLLSHFIGLFDWQHAWTILVNNSVLYLNLFLDVFSRGGGEHGWGFHIMQIVFVALLVYGFGWRFWKHNSPVEYFILLFPAMLFLWPYATEGYRYLLPIIPLAIFYVAVAIQDIASRLKMNLSLVVGALTISLVVLNFQDVKWIISQQDKPFLGPFDADAQQMFSEMKYRTKGEVVAFENARAFAFYTGISTVRLEGNADHTTLKKFKVDYLLCMSDAGDRARKYIMNHPGTVDSVWSNNRFTLYSVKR